MGNTSSDISIFHTLSSNIKGIILQFTINIPNELINNINNYDGANNRQWLLTADAVSELVRYNKYIPKSDRLPVEKLIYNLNTCECMTKYRSYVDIFNISYESLPLQHFMTLLCRHGGDSHLDWFNRLHESNYLSMNFSPWLPFGKWMMLATKYNNVLILDYLLQQVTVTVELLSNIINRAIASKKNRIIKYIMTDYSSFKQCIERCKKYIKHKRHRKSSNDESNSDKSSSDESSSDVESGKKCRVKNKPKPNKSILHKVTSTKFYKAVYQ